MKAKIKYTNEPQGNPKVVADFLPSPEELAFRDESVKVTLSLSKRSVDFFKLEARKTNTQYQRMIRKLVCGIALEAGPEHGKAVVKARGLTDYFSRNDRAPGAAPGALFHF